MKEGIIGVLKVAKKRTNKWTKRLSKQNDEEGKLKDELKARKKEKRKMEDSSRRKEKRT